MQWRLCIEFFSVLFSFRWGRKSNQERLIGRNEAAIFEAIPRYSIGLLDGRGFLDWHSMSHHVASSTRLPGDLSLAANVVTPDNGLFEPRLWVPLYNPNALYLALGPSTLDCSATFPDKTEQIETFQDYFRVTYEMDPSKGDRLFVAQRLWYQPAYSIDGQDSRTRSDCRPLLETNEPLPEEVDGSHHVASDLDTVLLPQGLCREANMADPTVALLSLLLPQFLYHLEHHWIADSFELHCKQNLPQLNGYLEQIPKNEILFALTAKSAMARDDYERLEWLGDGVLKLLQSDALLNTPELEGWAHLLHEGDLSTIRSAMGRNEYLAGACRRIGIDKYISTVPLSRGKWIPASLEVEPRDNLEGTTRKLPGDKVCADVMESLLGLVYLNCGYEAAQLVGCEFGLSLPPGPVDRLQRPSTEPRPQLLETVKRLTSMTSFRRPGLVEEALTHPSAIHEQVSSYQRLEWIGDAVLCLATREWILRKYPTMPVGDMVALEAALVSNEILGYQCFQAGLHRNINHRDQSLPSRLEQYERSTGEGGRGMWTSDPPKVMADVVEAVIGAAHVDSRFRSGQTAVLTLWVRSFLPLRLLLRLPKWYAIQW